MESQDPTSQSLLVRVKANDQDAWQRLVSLYSPLVVYWCRQGGVHGDDVQDVVQDVFGAVAVVMKTYRQDGTGSSFRAWLRGIARHKIRDHLRRGPALAEGGTEAQVRLSGLPVEDQTPALSESDGEVASLYRRALEQVKSQFEDRTWQAFWRVAMDERSPSDVAAELGLSPNSVRQAKSRVLRRLKEELGELIA